MHQLFFSFFVFPYSNIQPAKYFLFLSDFYFISPGIFVRTCSKYPNIYIN